MDRSIRNNKAIDPRREDPDRDLDLRKVISYGKEKGIGIFLYVDRTAAEPYLDAALPVWKEWGIAGIKLGFVKVGPQEWTRWLVDAVKKCHEYGLDGKYTRCLPPDRPFTYLS